MRTGFYLLSSAILSLTSIVFAQDFRPEIPRVWDDKEVAGFEMPLAQRDRSPRYMTAAEYYALKVRPIYRSSLCANIDETLPAVIINEQGGKEKHRERNQDCSSFYSEFAGF